MATAIDYSVAPAHVIVRPVVHSPDLDWILSRADENGSRFGSLESMRLSGRRLRGLMRRHGVTIRELARRMGATMKSVRTARTGGVSMPSRLDYEQAIGCISAARVSAMIKHWRKERWPR